MANHSKERTQAEAQLKKTQKAQRPPKDRRLCPNMWPLVMPFVQRPRELRLVLSENFIRRRFAS
jgi:hypothetical protein